MKSTRCLLLLLLLHTVITLAQEEPSIKDFTFKSVSNPSFVLLDETPTSFNMPDNLKALGVYLSNNIASTNLAVELNPYWVLGWHKEDKSYEEYRGLSTAEDDVAIDPLRRLKTNSSISFAFVDKEFANLEEPRKTLTLGGRFTFLELYNKQALKELTAVLQEIGSAFSSEVLNKFDGYIRTPDIAGGPDLVTPNDPEECVKALDSGVYPQEYVRAALDFFNANQELVSTKYDDHLGLLKDYYNASCRVSSAFIYNAQEIRPFLRLDGAVGYSWLFQENNINSATASRFGSWLTADVSLKLTDSQYLHIYGIGRYIDDGFQINQAGGFTSTDFVDFGGKLEFEVDKFKFSYEYLQRTGDGDMYRSVGNLYYQLTKSIALTGGFGKDFQAEDNLISIFGISWGIDSGERPFGL